jgi:hypothetical protein
MTTPADAENTSESPLVGTPLAVQTAPVTVTEAPRGSGGVLVVPVLVGCLVALALGAYGGLHQPTGRAVNVAGFSSPLTVKTWLATIALLLAVVQTVTAAGMWGRLGWADRPWTAPLHRWSGRLAVLVLLPVAVQCLYALGFQYGSVRVLVHSLLGCLFFGAFVAKMLALPRPNLPGWTIPLLGGVVAALLVALWLTSALWFFTTFGLKT